MARFRKAAIAVLAASALLLAPTAAYADHNHRGVGLSSQRGMSWGYSSGKLTDYRTTEPEVFNGARASAVMMGLDGRSVFRLSVTGIDASKGVYGVHLHQGTCDAKDWSKSGDHYNVNWNPLGALSDREVWLDLSVKSDGSAQSTATVSFIPEGNRSIVLHALPTNPETGKAGDRLACLPFKIKAYGN